MNVISLLKRSIEELKTDGWIKDDFHDEAGRHCAIGAVEAALAAEFGSGGAGQSESGYFANVPEAQELFRKAVDVLDRVAEKRGFEDGIASYNDDFETEFTDILGAFQKAILLAKKGVPASV